ncbi:MAG: hypothetical protein H7Z43_01900 [Clostridia bacterium]|nr:hypothetical protein [Deltaproteobacteria bacterium]
MSVAQSLGTAQKAELKSGLCGAQASDPRTIALAQQLDLDWISVPRLRLPTSRLAAAHAALGARVSPSDGHS